MTGMRRRTAWFKKAAHLLVRGFMQDWGKSRCRSGGRDQQLCTGICNAGSSGLTNNFLVNQHGQQTLVTPQFHLG
jgi:hypothetical protein